MARLSNVFVAIGAVVACSQALADDHEVVQKNQSFSTPALTIKAGDTVTFRNDDKINHSVYSVSDAKSFDVGSQAPGKTSKITFDKPGVVDVECAVHDNMHMKITVTP